MRRSKGESIDFVPAEGWRRTVRTPSGQPIRSTQMRKDGIFVTNPALRRYEPDYMHPTPVLRHGGKGDDDVNGAREPFLFAHGGKYYLHYDGNGPDRWCCCLAVSDDMIRWEKRGRMLTPGGEGEKDRAGACYGPTFYFEGKWHLYYVAVERTSGPPWFVPALPYRTGLAVADSPEGQWTKVSTEIIPLGEPGSWNEGCVCAPYVLKVNGTYYAFYSGSNFGPPYRRTIGLAAAPTPRGPWTHFPEPLLPPEEQLENPFLYFEPVCGLWFMFVNHVGRDGSGAEYTDSVLVYWSPSLTEWNPEDKAVVADASNVPWAPQAIGLPAGLAAGGKLWIAFDASSGTIRENFGSHMRRDIGMCSFQLPLRDPRVQRQLAAPTKVKNSNKK